MQFWDKQWFLRLQKAKIVKSDNLDIIKIENFNQKTLFKNLQNACLTKDCFPEHKKKNPLLQLGNKDK